MLKPVILTLHRSNGLSVMGGDDGGNFMIVCHEHEPHYNQFGAYGSSW